MSIKIMSWVWDNSPYTGKALLIHLALADWAGDDGVCWPKQDNIAAKARCSVETVRTATRVMEQDGLLEIVQESRGRGSSHRYRLLNPKSSAPNDLAQMNRATPQIEPPITPNPSPKNHQEPPRTNKCPYCRTETGNHYCTAMNMRIK